MSRHGLDQCGVHMGLTPVEGVVAANQAFEWLPADLDGLWFSLQNAHGVKASIGAEPKFSPSIDSSTAGVFKIQWV